MEVSELLPLLSDLLAKNKMAQIAATTTITAAAIAIMIPQGLLLTLSDFALFTVIGRFFGSAI